MSSPILPKALQPQYHSGPGAFPSQVPIQDVGGTTLHVFGGLNKLEYAALMIYASSNGITPDQAVSHAFGVLEACNKKARELADSRGQVRT